MGAHHVVLTNRSPAVLINASLNADTAKSKSDSTILFPYKRSGFRLRLVYHHQNQYFHLRIHHIHSTLRLSLKFNHNMGVTPINSLAEFQKIVSIVVPLYALPHPLLLLPIIYHIAMSIPRTIYATLTSRLN